MVKRIVVGAAFVLCAACGSKSEPTVDHDGSGSATGAGGQSDNECSGEVVETRLPGVTGEAVALCRACDHGCELAGEPCDSYGSSCDFFGETGVCIACCDGERGELRCSNID